jgi:hypothetical protein
MRYRDGRGDDWADIIGMLVRRHDLRFRRDISSMT